MILDLPRRHPRSGSGYANSVVVLDGRQLGDVLSIFGQDGEALAALMIAHEAAHNVQAQLRSAVGSALTGAAKELQADCLAGWWIARADARGGTPRFAIPQVERGLPDASIGHGTPRDRASAMGRGIR